MVRRYFAIISLIFVILLLFSFECFAQGNENESELCEITVINEEFLSGDDFGDWLPTGYSDFCGIGVWPDGSFFVHLGDHINIYDAEGRFSHGVRCRVFGGGAVKSRAVDEDNIQILIWRKRCLLTIDTNGEIIDTHDLSESDFAITESDFPQSDAKYFSANRYTIETAHESYEIEIPPIFSLPGLKNTHITLSLISEQSNIRLYDDGGIVFFRHFMIFVILVLVFSIVIPLYLRYKKRQDNQTENENKAS